MKSATDDAFLSKESTLLGLLPIRQPFYYGQVKPALTVLYICLALFQGPAGSLTFAFR